MLYLIGGVMILICSLLKKSKIVFFLMLLYMWVLFAWSNGNADTDVYLYRFYNYNLMESQTEPIFTFIMYLCNRIGFEYQQFLIVFSLISLIIISKTIKEFTVDKCWVLLLYFIFPFCIDVVQIRNLMAFLLIVYGFRYLLSDESYTSVKYLICVIIATCIHYISIFYVIFILLKRWDVKRTIIITGITTLILSSLNNVSFIFNFMTAIFNNQEKVTGVLDRISKANDWNIATIRLKMIIYFVSFLVVLVIAYYNHKNNSSLPIEQISKQNKIIELVIKMNIVVLVFIPLISYNLDFYRVQRYLSLFNYIAIAQYRSPKFLLLREKIPYYFYVVLCFVIAILTLYLQILKINDYYTVFKPLFESNLLF